MRESRTCGSVRGARDETRVPTAPPAPITVGAPARRANSFANAPSKTPLRTDSSSEMGSAIHHRLTKLVLLARQYELPHKQGLVHGACFSHRDG